MRADRLVAILMLLQTRSRVTAAEVAAELEISERTARRDLDALAMSGVPLYSVQGRNGGWRLAGGGRTDLSGLTAAEARALFLVAGPSSAATPELRAALRKLVRALPEPLRDSAQTASSAVVVEPHGWDQQPRARRTPPHLEAVQRAVVDGDQVALGYVARDGASTTRIVHPLGLAAKGSVWYLVADTDGGLRTFRVDRVASIEPTGEKVVRPDGFDLADAWRLIAEEVDQRRTPLRVRALVARDAQDLCRWIFGTRVQFGAAQPDGRIEVELRGHNVPALAGEIASFGGAVEVLDAPEVAAHLARIGAELTERYG
ncbi:MAG TPA: YafY family protein [Acidimicrobiia bacterium]|jgi:predicted DNA-binding transcriptional regulator YafY